MIMKMMMTTKLTMSDTENNNTNNHNKNDLNYSTASSKIECAAFYIITYHHFPNYNKTVVLYIIKVHWLGKLRKIRDTNKQVTVARFPNQSILTNNHFQI